jgi:hypothetical protein
MVLQAFIFRWGGFLVEDAGDEGALAAEFLLTASDLAACFDLLHRVFPPSMGSSWFRTVRGARWLILVPYPVQGLGVIYRDAVRPGWDSRFAPPDLRALRARQAAAAALM